MHAQHVLCGSSIEMVRVDGSIVAMPTSMPCLAVKTLDLDVSLVMLAAQGWFGRLRG